MRRRALRARNQLACHNLRLISHTWRRHRTALPLEAENTADALQEAAIALLRAAEQFDPARGYCFSTYASFWVRRGFNEHDRRQRRLIRLPAHWLETLAKVQRLIQQHQALHGCMPSLAWLAERCGKGGKPLSVQRLRFLLLSAQRLWPKELDEPIWSARDEEDEITLLDLVPDSRGTDPTLAAAAALELAELPEVADFPDAAALLASCAGDGHDEQRALLPQLLRVLSPTERRLLWHRYLREHPLTLRQLQRVMGLSAEQQEAMERRALRKLRKAAKAAGMDIPL
jgi:RNA polymerase primary sigma factor